MIPLDRWLRSQLRNPDPLGVDLALLRTRLYRVSVDLEHYLLAEELERHYLEARVSGCAPAMITEALAADIRAWLAHLRTHSTPPPIPRAVLADLGVDPAAARARRAEHLNASAGAVPAHCVVILGAPRSGTSHLYNLLAATGSYAFLTTASCWAWPTYQLRQPHQRHFRHLLPEVLAVDNKRTRIIPGLVMPGEAEDLFHRCLPTYRRHRGHSYDIEASDHPPTASARRLFAAAVSAHRAHFGSDILLTKSPFHAFRIPGLEQLCQSRVSYLHITRDRAGCADSLRRNDFTFGHRGQPLSAEMAYDLFTTACMSAPPERYLQVTHQQLVEEPDRLLAGIRHWIEHNQQRFSCTLD